MLCLLEGHDMLSFIMSENVLVNTIGFRTAKDVWVHIKASYGALTPKSSASLATKKKLMMENGNSRCFHQIYSAFEVSVGSPLWCVATDQSERGFWYFGR